MAIFGVAYSPLRVSVGMQVTEGVLTQEYDPGASEYAPDRRIRPTAILPVVSVSDPAGLLAGGVANAMLADIFWYEGEASEANVILDSNPDYDIDKTSDNTNRGRITVYKNVPFNQPLTLVFKAVLVDMAGGKVRRKANVMGSVDLTTSTASSSPLVLVQGYPRGNLYNILDQRALKLSAKLMSGTEEIPSAFWWYKKDGTKLTPLEDLDGAKTGELTVPVDYVGRRGKFVAKVQDCRKDLKAVQDAWLDAELEKVRDYPRNLVAKQYMMDWNEVHAGITVKGSDADGEYWKVDFQLVRTYIGGSTDEGDVFQGKVEFQPDTRYALKVKWKTSEAYSVVPAIFVFVYTDGTTSRYAFGISNYEGVLVEDRFVSAEGKTLKNIGVTYGGSGTVNIYDLQVTELHEENLIGKIFIEKIGEYATIVEQSETLYGDKTWKVTNINDGQPPAFIGKAILKNGKTYTMSCYVKTGTTTGSKFGRIIFYDTETSRTLSYKDLTENTPEWTQLSLTFTPDKDYGNIELRFYGGGSVGNELYMSCMKLEEGDTATPGYVPKWIPAAADLAVEAEGQSLPAGYRPSTQGDTHDGEYDLAVKMPKVATKVVTPWGDDKEVIMIPPGVKLFPARIQVDTPQGTLDNPAEYFSADWGNGMKGMQVLLDAEQIGTGTMVVEPDIYDDLSKARYGVGRVTITNAGLEEITENSRVVVELDGRGNSESGYAVLLIDSNGSGVGVICNRETLAVYIFLNGKRSAKLFTNNSMLHRVEFVIGNDFNTSKVFLNGVDKGNYADGIESTITNNYVYVQANSIMLLAEIYSPDGTLLHKWDMEGETDNERLADKAVTENKINLSKSTGFKLTPI